jgi:hypothetical protein
MLLFELSIGGGHSVSSKDFAVKRVLSELHSD